MKLQEQAVLKRQVWLLSGSVGEGVTVLDAITDKLDGTPKCVSWKYQTANGGVFRQRNPLSLIVTDSLIPEHRVCITAHNWGGKKLCIAWLLLAAPSLVQSIRRYAETQKRDARYRVDDMLNPFDQVELHCLSTVTYEATKAVIDDIAQAKKVVAAKSTGFDDLAATS